MRLLTATSHEERRAALEVQRAAIKISAERAVAELQEQIRRATKDAQTRIESAEREVEATRQSLAGELVNDLHAELGPLVRAFRDEPTRRGAVSIAELWVQFGERARVELGAELWPGQLLLAFGDALIEVHPNAAWAFGQDDWCVGGLGRIYEHAARALRPGATPHDIQKGLEDVDHDLTSAARATDAKPREPRLERRYALKRCATSRDATIALEAFDRECEAAKRAVPPPGTPNPVGARIE